MSLKEPVSRFPEIIEPLLNEKSVPGRNQRPVPQPFKAELPADLACGEAPQLPEVSEVETVRHFTRLSRLNFGLDHGLYPLGSCTMKHNPKIVEAVAAGFNAIHPADETAMATVLGHLKGLEEALCEICGLDAACLWPAAGAHGELTGVMVIRKALDVKGLKRRTILIPDTAHGTNPASCTLAGFKTKPIAIGPEGYLRAETLDEYLDDDVAGLMITNPNTLGIFERDIKLIADKLHAVGAYLYMDGANMNALMGVARPGDMGVDCLHLNLHKTFATPHGGGGPGSGPVLVTAELADYLPNPRLKRAADGACSLASDAPAAIGAVHSHLGNVNVLLKAYAYILALGGAGLKQATTKACLNAGYLKAQLAPHFDLPYAAATLHEFVLSDKRQKENEVTTLDMAKALMDFGFHPPTVYFPLVVSGAMMIEPTESEPLDELDRFASALKTIAELAGEGCDFHAYPQTTPVSRLDEVKAARQLKLTWRES
ncbi:MAG: putative glycine dehydrogenase (decarboxylating) subunit 2 [Deltaproteobacteria bacterium ADurb.Bin510]|nr:MAG: putative glycine dehydrogenase (decarboxylating) subunit 2 [Deltaproteobacteria bacterium ADurb.Bin510]